MYTVGCLNNVVQYDNIAYITAVTKSEYKSEYGPTKDTPHLTLMGELWSVFCQDFQENWLRYNNTTLYFII